LDVDPTDTVSESALFVLAVLWLKRKTDLSRQAKGRGEIGRATRTTTTHLRRTAAVRRCSLLNPCLTIRSLCRRDDQQLCPGATSESGEKEGGEQTAGSGDGAPASATVPADKNAMPQIVAGSVLHLVLALRGGAYS
jgi:hypothetical protein